MAGGNNKVDDVLADVVVANLHKRFTGVSRTVAELIPRQRKLRDISLIDSGRLGLGPTWSFLKVLRRGWSRPSSGEWRVFHARRDVEMIAGLALKLVPGQKWKVIFTSAAPKVPNQFLTFLINRMDAVVAASQRSADYLPWHTCIIGHGVDTDAFQPARDREAALAEVGLDQHLVIGAFGRVRPSKGTDTLVEALLSVLPDHEDVVCILSGLVQDKDAPFYDDLVDQIESAGLSDRIRFVGDQSDAEIRRWYQRISLCVAASRSEGYGLTPFEAFASGAAAVTSDAGVWPWTITPDVGLRFETGSPASLAACLETLLFDRARLADMGKAARQAAVEQFSITREVESIEALYQQLLRGDVLPRRST